MLNDNEKEVVKQGKPWTNIATFSEYDKALSLKTKLLEEKPDHQTKIKLLSSGFVVKSRLHPDLQPKKEVKKNGKNRKSRKRNTEERES